jgi:hypothetical protein
MANNNLVASDNFASGSLAAGWTSIASGFGTVVAGTPNVVETSAVSASRYGQRWTGNSFPRDQISEITVNLYTVEAGSSIALYTRHNGTNYYVANFNGTNVTIQNTFGGALVTGTGLTINPGDVLSFCASGSCLSVYHNSSRVCYYYDTNLTAGAPGFDEISSVAASHMQISSWRGYSTVQQDGIWTKQGIVIPANTADLTSGWGCANPSQIIYEGNAQLLSGNVYKMWFASWGANAVGYAESSDGLNWTRKSTAVSGVTGIDPGVIKNGSTYWMYATTSATPGPIAAYTSSDGITWTQQSSNIGVGSAFFFTPVAIVGGTFYAFTSPGASNHTWTSTDGTTWTDQGAATGPPGFMCGGFAQVGATYYVWCQTFPPGKTDGTEIARYKSTSLTGPWTLDVHSAHVTQPFESVNTFTGQCVPGGIIDIGGTAHLYATECPGDAASPAIYQIGLLTAPSSISGIVLHPEDAAPQVASDGFTYGNGPLPTTNWTTYSGWAGMPQIVSGPFLEAAATGAVYGAYYTGASFNSNQYSEVTIHAINHVGGNDFVIPFVRLNPVNGANYNTLITGTTGSTATVIIQANNGSVQAQIGPSTTINIAVGDRIRIQAINGSDGFPVVSVFHNNFCILQVEDYSNAMSAGGSPGVIFLANVAIANAQISAWAGGNASVMPTYFSSTSHQQLRLRRES